MCIKLSVPSRPAPSPTQPPVKKDTVPLPDKVAVACF